MNEAARVAALALDRRRAPLWARRNGGRGSDRREPRPLRPASRWRSSRPRARASRRCCMWRACSSGRTPAKSMIGGAATSTMSDDKRTALRRTEIGFVYQFHHLLPEFSALENLVLPQMIAGLSRAEAARARARPARLFRPRRAREPSAGGTVGRRAAARRDRARRRQRPAGAAGRRADRQSRPEDRRPRVRDADGAGQGERPRRAHRHPQHGPRRPHGPPRDDPRRAGRGGGVGTPCVDLTSTLLA